MGISAQGAILNQFVPPFCIDKPVNGDILMYDYSTKSWLNQPFSLTMLPNATVTPGNMLYDNNNPPGPGDVLTVSDDLLTFKPVPATDFSVTHMADLDDVAIGLSQNGQFLKYDSNFAQWENTYATTDDLADMDTTGIVTGQAMLWDGAQGKFIAGDTSGVASTTFSGLLDTPSNYTDSDGMSVKVDTFNGKLVFAHTMVNELADVDLDTTAPVNNDVLTYVGGTWVPRVAASAGEANTASNIGTGEGIFAQKTAADLELKSIVGGSNVSVTSDATSVTINAGSMFESIRIDYNSFGKITSVSEFTDGINVATTYTSDYIDFVFDHSRPPTSITFYGYKVVSTGDYGYKMTMPASSNMVNEVITGGNSTVNGGPPTALTDMINGKIRLPASTLETYADFNEHAYIFFSF